jgi:hypothetical protein
MNMLFFDGHVKWCAGDPADALLDTYSSRIWNIPMATVYNANTYVSVSGSNPTFSVYPGQFSR